jgi:hypothetical protein
MFDPAVVQKFEINVLDVTSTSTEFQQTTRLSTVLS